MLEKRVAAIAGLAVALMGALGVASTARAASEHDAAAAGVRAMIAQTNALMKRNGSLKDFMNLFYEKDIMITGEGETVFYKDLRSFEKPLAGYLANQTHCRLTIKSPIRSSGNIATAFLQEHCDPATSADKPEDYRILYVFRRNSKGWHVMMEMFTQGVL
jgi:ketosteroid isomerase-like protein